MRVFYIFLFSLPIMVSALKAESLTTLHFFVDETSTPYTIELFRYANKLMLSEQMIGSVETNENGLATMIVNLNQPDLFLFTIAEEKYEIYLKPQYHYQVRITKQGKIKSIDSDDRTYAYMQKTEQEIANYLSQYQDKKGKYTKDFRKNEYAIIQNVVTHIKGQEFYKQSDELTQRLIQYEVLRFQTDYLLEKGFLIQEIENRILQIDTLPTHTAFWVWLDELMTHSDIVLPKSKVSGLVLRRYNLAYNAATEINGTWVYEEFKNEIQADVPLEKVREILWLKGISLCYEVGNVDIELIKKDLNHLIAKAYRIDVREYAQEMLNNMERVQLGQVVPDFTVNDLKGKPIQFASYYGKPILLEFWATWCVTCVKEMKEMPTILEKYGDRLQVISISVDEQPEKVVRYLKQNPHYSWQFLSLPDYQKIAEKFGISGFPAYFLLDENGRMRHILEESPKNELKKMMSLLGKYDD